MESDHQFSDRVTDSDRSLSPSDTMNAVNNRNSFCIDALLAKDNRCHSPSTSTNSMNTSRSTSISPGSEIQELRAGSFEEFQLPNSASNRSNMLTMSSAAAILANHGHDSNQNNGSFYGLYPVGSSAFQPLPRMEVNARTMNIPGAVTKMLGPVGHSTMTAGHIQQMQLEWFARAGMFYAGPRLQDSPGSLLVALIVGICVLR